MKLVPLCLALLVAGCGGASIDSADAAGDLGAGLPPDLALSADVDLGTSDLDTDGGFVPAGIVVRCNGAVVKTRTCPSLRWVYDFSACNPDAGQTGNARTVVLENSGPYPVAYVARSAWALGAKYVPGKLNDGGWNELYGTIPVGGSADISTAYEGGIFALVGSAHPFTSDPSPTSDEGTTSTFNVAQLSASDDCSLNATFF